jgi:hypothetical protein
MQRKARELWLALVAIVFITLVYLGMQAVYHETPPASGFFGHSMGVVGFILMLSTETLYSLRKRSHNGRWGKLAGWLEFHIFTGLVGPYMVLLHSAWRFNGLAGVLMLLTILIVVSGFVGRYIYTAIPRAMDGSELEEGEIQLLLAESMGTDRRAYERLQRQASRLASARRMMSLWHTIHIPIGLTLFLLAFTHVGAAIYFAVLLR